MLSGIHVDKENISIQVDTMSEELEEMRRVKVRLEEIGEIDECIFEKQDQLFQI